MDNQPGPLPDQPVLPPPPLPAVPTPATVFPSIGTGLDLNQLPKPGRPKGSKDRFSRRERKFLKMSFWFAQLKKDWPKLQPSQRAGLCFDFIKLLIEKAKNLPQNPNDSKKSAEEILEALRDLEASSVQPMVDSGKSIAFNHPDNKSTQMLTDVNSNDKLSNS